VNRAIARLNPFDDSPPIIVEWTEGMTLRDIVERVHPEDWFWEVGEVFVYRGGGVKKYKPDIWRYAKPRPNSFIELRCTINGGKAGRIAMVLASVALSVVLPGIGTAISGALVTAGLGATTAGLLGSIGAGAFGLGVMLGLNALTPPPSQNQTNNGQRELASAGISGNALTPGEYVAGVLGRIRVSPQIVAPVFTTLEDDDLFTHGLFAVANDCLGEDVMINGVRAAEIPRLQMEIIPGDGSNPDTFLSSKTVVHGGSAVLSNFDLENEQPSYDHVKNQLVPTDSDPKKIPFRKPATANEFVLRLLFESGIFRTTDGASGAVPIRIFLRKRGDVLWRSLPEIHIKDTKGSGAFRREIKLMWTPPPPGFSFSFNNALDVYMAYSRVAVGEIHEYVADPYFNQFGDMPVDAVPVLSDYTSGAVTVSASSEFSSSFRIWYAFDGSSTTTAWAPTLNSLPAWIQVDHGSGNTKTIKSISIWPDSTGSNYNKYPKNAQLEGSNDGTVWTLIHDMPNSDSKFFNENVTFVAPFRFHRLTILENNGASSQEIRIGRILLSEEYTHTQVYPSTLPNTTTLRSLAANVHLNYTGATIYLDPQQWPEDEYEVQIQRGWAYVAANLLTNGGADYSYIGSPTFAHFFVSRLLSGFWIVTEGQKTIQSKTIIETTTAVHYQRPIRAALEARLTRIAIRVPNMNVNSVSAVFTSKFRNKTDGQWDSLPSPTRNPASAYRDLLLTQQHNARPVPGEVMDESSLEAAYDWCDVEGYTCDAVIQNKSVSETLKLIASTARSSVRRADLWGWVIDRDRSLDTIEAMLTPETSRDQGTTKTFDKIPHGLRITYLDEDDDWQQKEVMVYRDGYSSDTAIDVVAMTFEGVTSLSRATSLALFMLRQMYLRNVKYTREVGREGKLYARGTLFGIADEVIFKHAYYGLVKSFITDGSNNVTGLTVYGVIPLSKSAEAISDTEGALGTFGCNIRQAGGLIVTRQIVEQVDTSTITFTTHAGPLSLYDLEQPVGIGPLGFEQIRAILHTKQYNGNDRWLLTLLPEAPLLHT
jgi:hypothetical protein